jgi:hypothetical protein
MKLIKLIQERDGWLERFERSLDSVKKYDLDEFSDIHTLEDWLNWCNNFLYWVPTETPDGKTVSNMTTKFYFYFNQRSLISIPNRYVLHRWMVEYVRARGLFFRFS